MHVHFPAFMLPEPERGYTYILNHLLSDLVHHEGRFVSALDLFDFCAKQISAVGDQARGNMDLLFTGADTRDRFASWMQLAGRDAAITIFDFARTAYQINETINKCPTIKPFVDTKELNKALSAFQKAFPNAKSGRDAAAHPSADLHSTPAKRAQNSFTGQYNQHGISIDAAAERGVVKGIMGRHVVDTIRGEIVSFELSPASLHMLRNVRLVYEKTFSSAKEDSRDSFERSFEAQGLKPNA